MGGTLQFHSSGFIKTDLETPTSGPFLEGPRDGNLTGP